MEITMKKQHQNKRNKKHLRKIYCALLVIGLCVMMAPVRSRAASGSLEGGQYTYQDQSSHLAYTLKNIPNSGIPIQNFYVTSNYVYATQRAVASGDGVRDDVTFMRFAINEQQKTATYKDSMTLLNCGHGEILDRYSYKGTYYFLVGTKPNEDSNPYYWSLQVGRVKYTPGAKLNYTKVCRLAGLASANKAGKSDMDAIRVAAATSGDDTQLVIRTELKGEERNYLQYSTYDLKKVNALLDKVEHASKNYLLFGGNASLTSACKYSFTQAKGQAVIPNGSFQGIEISGAYIYVSGGKDGTATYPKIAKIRCTDGKFVSGVNIATGELPNRNPFILYRKETEGLCCRGDKMYFGIINGSEQLIQYISKF